MVLVILLLPILLILLSFLLQRHKNKRNVLPPGPKPLPLIGNLHQLDISAPHRDLWQLSKKYGPLMYFRFGLLPVLVVCSAKMAKEVLQTHDLIFCSRPYMLAQRTLSYDGIDLAFSAYNNYWRELKKLCMFNFFNSRVKTFRPVKEFEVSHMIEKISKAAAALEPVNISDAILYLTSTIICRVAFGKRYEEEGTELKRFQAMLTETQELFASFFLTDHIPFLGFVDKLTGLFQRVQKNFKEFDAFNQEIVDEHLDPNKPKPEEANIVDFLFEVRKNPSSKVDLTIDNIKALLMNMFIGGTDIGAANVVWAMTLLMKNPVTLKKAQEEIRNLIGNKGFVDEGDIQHLSYLKAVIKETMRLQPAIPFLIPRESTKKCNINGYEIPAKTTVFVNVWAIGRDSDAWENPEEFCPERFIDNSINLKGQHFELIPFGAGRRICPGMFIGLSTVELALANLLYKFNWEMPPGMSKEDIDMEVSPTLTLHKKNPLYLVAVKHDT